MHRTLRPLFTGLLQILLVAIPITAACGTSDQPKTTKVPDGTIVRVALTDSLSSGTSHQNDRVHFEVTEDVVVGGVLVIARGAPALGHVTEADPKGKWGHEGKLGFTVDYVKAVDGTNVRLRASSSQGGGDSKAAIMLGLSGAFKHGKNVEQPKGTQLDTYVDGDREVAISGSSPKA